MLARSGPTNRTWSASLATERSESCVGDAPRLHANGEFEDVPANRILNGNGCRGSIENAGIAWILEMVQYGRAVHAQSIARAHLKFNANARQAFTGRRFLLRFRRILGCAFALISSARVP